MNRHCSVCGGGAKKVLYHQRFSHLSEGSLLKGYDVVICQHCGFGFADQIPDQSVFDSYYRDMSKYDYQERGGKESPFDEERFEETAVLISRFLPNRKAAILDVGCSTGGLLWKIKKLGFPNVFGLDPSPLCASAAMKLYNIHVSNRSITDLSALGQPVDFLILVGVLEHLRDLSTAVEEIGKIIVAKGQLYVEVPDVSAFASVPDAPFQQLSLEHINFFSAQSLTNLMITRGFRLVYSQRLLRRQSQNTVMPVVTAIFQKRKQTHDQYIMDTETERCLVEYIQESAATDQRICEIIDDIVASGRRIVVWGVGTHTMRLMETSRLSRANIRAFVDSNIHYQKKKLHGIPIISPSELIGLSEPILISSRVFQQEIEKQVRNELGLENELLTLYEIAP